MANVTTPIAAFIALMLIGIAPASAQCTIDIPTTLDTSAYDILQLPVAGARGKPLEIRGADVQRYTSALFERSPGAITMRVPTAGLVTTTHSDYPRTELKENRIWNVDDGCAAEAARVTILQLPPTGDIVIGQIHQEASIPRPPMELHYHRGAVYAALLDHQTTEARTKRARLDIVGGIPVGVAFDYTITLAKGGLLTVTVNGTSRSARLDPSLHAARLYFKAGNYTQDRTGGSAVTFVALAIQHRP